MADLKLSIYTPERRLIEGALVEEVTLTGSEGQIQVLPGHASMLGTLQSGVFSYRSAGSEPVFGVISSGFFDVQPDDAGESCMHLNVMAETLELKGEIDLERARKAQKLAEETLKAADIDEHQFKKYQLKLQRALIRQQIGS